jgi:hypothetical protein
MKTSEYLKALRLAVALNDRVGYRILIENYRIGDDHVVLIPSERADVKKGEL